MDKIQHNFESLQRAAESNKAIGFVRRNVKDGKYRDFNSHGYSSLLERSRLLANKENLWALQ